MPANTASKFVGTWSDQRGFLATITPDEDGTFTVKYEPRAGRPAFPNATEVDFALAAPILKVNFTDDPEGHSLVGASTESVDGIRRILWSNNTTWFMVSPAVTPFETLTFSGPSAEELSAAAGKARAASA